MRKCPNGYYSIVNGTNGFRECTQNCKAHGLIKDNSTNRCVPVTDCPTDPYMYSDWNEGKCVF